MKFTNNLSRVRIATPCPAEWEKMTGTERARFCHACNLNVYNLSAMTRDEAERFVANADGRVCVRFYRRADGTILTQNCPVGVAKLKQRATRIATATLSAMFGFLSGFGINAGFQSKTQHGSLGVKSQLAEPVKEVGDEMENAREVMGAINGMPAPIDETVGRIAITGEMAVDWSDHELTAKKRRARRSR